MTAPVLILYGSQTGNAQDVAERMGRECKQLGYAPRVLAMDGYPITQLPEEKVVLFAVSTTGQGELPENMRASWKFLLRKSLPATSLSQTSYAVFGLGDSGYVKYNVAAKKLDRRLAALSAMPIVERGLGDDQHPSSTPMHSLSCVRSSPQQHGAHAAGQVQAPLSDLGQVQHHYAASRSASR